jgi:RIO kinase 1
MPQTRPRPSWVIRDDFEDSELGVLRSGKEAGCFLVRRRSGERWCLLVRKDYQKRSDREYSAPVRAGERGLRRDAYTQALKVGEAGRHRPDARSGRAVRKRTAYGWRALEGALAEHEYDTLRRLWHAGASVPYPVEECPHGFLMQYVGTPSAAAPRLADVRLGRDEAAAILDRLVDELRVFAREGIVHGDLSAYNVLMLHGRPWIIDLPQALDLYTDPTGPELFARDVVNVCTYFRKIGVQCDAQTLIGELLPDGLS